MEYNPNELTAKEAIIKGLLILMEKDLYEDITVVGLC